MVLLTHQSKIDKTNLRNDQGQPPHITKEHSVGTCKQERHRKTKNMQEHARPLGQLRDSVTQFGFVASRKGMRSSPSLAKSQAECWILGSSFHWLKVLKIHRLIDDTWRYHDSHLHWSFAQHISPPPYSLTWNSFLATPWNHMKPVPNWSLQRPSFVAIADRLRRFSRHLASASRIGTRSPRADSTAMGSDSVENIAVAPFRSPLFCSFQVHWQSARTPISIACLYTFYQSGEEWMEQVPSKYLLCSAFHFHLQVIRHHKAS